jgi:hypothetical protein
MPIKLVLAVKRLKAQQTMPRGNTATACCDRKVAMVALEMPREFISHPVMKQASRRYLEFHD